MSKSRLITFHWIIYIFVLMPLESVYRLRSNLPSFIQFTKLFYSNRFARELVVLTILMFIRKFTSYSIRYLRFF